MKLMPSQLKSDTARINGAKSNGPKSAETRAISSRNSLIHGLTARHTTVLECENHAEFEEILAGYFDTYKPANPAQENLVNEMVSARWRIRRIRIVETALLDMEVTRSLPEIKRQYTEPDSGIHMAEAHRVLMEESRTLSLISRYESRLFRMHERSYRTLRELQKADPPVPAQPASENDETNPPAPAAQIPQAHDSSKVSGHSVIAVNIARLGARRFLRRK